MTGKTADIFSQFEQIHERLEQAYRRLTGSGPGSPGFCPPFMEPPADVYETDEEVVILLEIAGIAGQEIEMQIEGRAIVIQGERKPLPGRPRRVYSQMEIASGPFRRELLLPADVNAEGVVASYKDGIVEVILPKAAPAFNRQLRITVK
jgi:HSP20 family protein